MRVGLLSSNRGIRTVGHFKKPLPPSCFCFPSECGIILRVLHPSRCPVGCSQTTSPRLAVGLVLAWSHQQILVRSRRRSVAHRVGTACDLEVAYRNKPPEGRTAQHRRVSLAGSWSGFRYSSFSGSRCWPEYPIIDPIWAQESQLNGCPPSSEAETALPKPALAMLFLPVYTGTAGHRGTRSSVFLSLHCIDQYGLCSRSGSANVIAFCCKISKCMEAENETVRLWKLWRKYLNIWISEYIFIIFKARWIICSTFIQWT